MKCESESASSCLSVISLVRRPPPASTYADKGSLGLAEYGSVTSSVRCAKCAWTAVFWRGPAPVPRPPKISKSRGPQSCRPPRRRAGAAGRGSRPTSPSSRGRWPPRMW
eukprot:scaffold3665_cov102-Isochrysis_galbana.AAC.4